MATVNLVENLAEHNLSSNFYFRLCFLNQSRIIHWTKNSHSWALNTAVVVLPTSLTSPFIVQNWANLLGQYLQHHFRITSNWILLHTQSQCFQHKRKPCFCIIQLEKGYPGTQQHSYNNMSRQLQQQTDPTRLLQGTIQDFVLPQT